MLENVLQNYLLPSETPSVVPQQTNVPVPTQNNVPVPIPTQNNVPLQVPRQNQSPLPDTNYRTQRQVDQMSILHTIREIMNSYNLNIREYNSNMREYNSTVIEALQLVRSLQRQYTNIDIPEPIREPTRSNQSTQSRSSNRNTRESEPYQTSQNRSTPIISYTLFPLLNSNINRGSGMQDVVVRPSREVIEQATERLTYSNDMILLNTQCPISLEEFVEGENIVRIRHCRHTFRETSINNWFQTNVRCPVCRHDIREMVTHTDISDNHIEEMDELSEYTTSLIRQYLDNSSNSLDHSNINSQGHDNDNENDSENGSDEIVYVSEIIDSSINRILAFQGRAEYYDSYQDQEVHRLIDASGNVFYRI